MNSVSQQAHPRKAVGFQQDKAEIKTGQEQDESNDSIAEMKPVVKRRSRFATVEMNAAKRAEFLQQQSSGVRKTVIHLRDGNSSDRNSLHPPVLEADQQADIPASAFMVKVRLVQVRKPDQPEQSPRSIHSDDPVIDPLLLHADDAPLDIRRAADSPNLGLEVANLRKAQKGYQDSLLYSANNTNGSLSRDIASRDTSAQDRKHPPASPFKGAESDHR